MKRHEISRELDAIVEFSGCSKYLDTPVKRYSSGMVVRLGFAVAAHLACETLVVDEVLAVGDAEFQQKCIGKMQEISQGDGRTVLFVSHNMGSISRLCNECVLMDQGGIEFQGDVNVAVSRYLNANRVGETTFETAGKNRFVFESIATLDPSGSIVSEHRFQDPICIKIQFSNQEPIPGLEIGVRVMSREGVAVFTTQRPKTENALPLGKNTFLIYVPGNFLSAGRYSLDIGAHIPNQQVIDFQSAAAVFHVAETGSEYHQYQVANAGLVVCPCQWKTVKQ